MITRVVVIAAAMLGTIPLTACRITPKEIEKIRVENDLLRTEIHTIKENCEYYRELEVEVDR